jgi:exosortase C (VPDSG-CTERM-specific)
VDTAKSPRVKGSSSSSGARAIGPIGWWRNLEPNRQRRVTCYLVCIAALTAAFVSPLYSLAVYAAAADLHSHILLIPFVSAFLIYLQRNELPRVYCTSAGLAMFPLFGGLVTLVLVIGFRVTDRPLSQNDFLALMALSFVCFLASAGFLFLGRQWMAAVAFPFTFLIFLIPLPDGVADWLETASRLASAEAANMFFSISGEPVLRQGTVFQLPGIVLEVAQECSGFRSSWVLFIVSVLASYLCLRTPWKRFLFVACVVPLGVLRNGFRVLVIGLLCIHLGPQMINSALHRHGGPLFFVLSLVPFYLLLWLLRKGEAEGQKSPRGGGQFRPKGEKILRPPS